MKKMILSAAFVLASTAAMAQSGTFQLKANLKNMGDTIISIRVEVKSVIPSW